LEELLGNIVDFLGTRAKTKKQTLTLQCPKEPLANHQSGSVGPGKYFRKSDRQCHQLYPGAWGDYGQGGYRGYQFRVQVIDNGFGIETRYLDKIFDRFFRVKNDKTRYITGTGLGLPIVKGLVESLNGQIRVESVTRRRVTTLECLCCCLLNKIYDAGGTLSGCRSGVRPPRFGPFANPPC
jgi:two-component system phosphate regulon sensor histidine kinase PhoR